MPTKRIAERAAIIAVHGDHCKFCGDGPLVRRALHTIVVPEMCATPVPACTTCRDIFASPDPKAALAAHMRALCRQYDKYFAAAQVLDLERVPVAKTWR